MSSIKARRIAPWEEDLVDTGSFAWRFLAEGDSWFSFGSFFGNSLLDALEFDRKTLIIQTAMPGDTLSRMADWWKDLNFANLLGGAVAEPFDAILVSGGGNDLVHALSAASPGAGVLRLFTPAEPPITAADCIDADAWSRFESYLRANFREISRRVKASRVNGSAPVFIHTYDFATPREAGFGFGRGPWLCRAFQAHNIPPMRWVPLMEELDSRLRTVLLDLDLRNVHVVDTLGTLQRADVADEGETLHWVNEIHPSAEGYRVLARAWKREVEAVLLS
jgi:lysophospholipase L1-like esterase